MNVEAITALQILASVGTLLLLLCIAYPQITVAWYRQDIFDLRDELFRLAANGGISFDSPAYGMLRSLLNGHLRYAHRWRLTPFLFRLLSKTAPPQALLSPSVREKWAAALRALPHHEQRACLASIRFRMQKATVAQVLRASPLATAAIALVGGAYLLARESFQPRFVRQIKNQTTATAYLAGAA